MLVKHIRAKLSIKTIPRIIGEPTYKTINKVWEVVYANAAVVPMTLGGGLNGNIGIIMDAAVYYNVATTAYARPTEPGNVTPLLCLKRKDYNNFSDGILLFCDTMNHIMIAPLSVIQGNTQSHDKHGPPPSTHVSI